MMPTPKLEHFLLCEDIRTEASQLCSVIGLFVAPLRLPGAGAIPQLTCGFVLRDMKGIAKIRSQIELQRPGEEPVTSYSTGSPQTWHKRDPEQDRHLHVHWFFPFAALSQGRHWFRAILEFDGADAVRAEAGLDVEFSAE